MTRVLLTTDVRLYRDGLTLLLERHPGMEVVGAAADAESALRAATTLAPDVVLVDLALAESLATIRALRTSDGALAVVVLAVADDDDDLLACAEAGAAGYVRRSGSLDDLVMAIEAAARGELQCSPRAAAALLRRVFALTGVRPDRETPTAPLTAREREIARLVERGFSNKEIARQLGIELPTVKNHVHHLLEKLGVRRRVEIGAAVRGARASHGVPGLPRPAGGAAAQMAGRTRPESTI